MHRRCIFTALAVLIVSGCSDPAAPAAAADVSDDVATAAPCVCDTSADTVCKRNTCQANGACAMTAVVDGLPCSDGDPCSVGDACQAGTCESGTKSACECKDTADCAGDGDKCNGAEFCDKSVLPWRCRTKPGTAVVCTVSDVACQVATCNKSTGGCTKVNRPDKTACDDGDKCTKNDACAKGTCTGLQTCTCKTSADCAAIDDGNLCNGVLFCDVAAGSCAVNPTTVIKCPPGDKQPCIVNACVPTTGLCTPKAAKKGTKCDDGDSCTSGDRCDGGICDPGTNTCACSKDADCAKHDDGNKCNGLQYCDKQSGTCKPNAGSIVTCPSVKDTACAHNVCQPASGTCAFTARKDVTKVCPKDGPCTWRMKKAGDPADKGPWPCDDGDPCTGAETCEGKLCKGSSVTCKCTTNSDCAAVDDGNLCNGTYYCDKALKVPDCVFNKASVVFCKKTDDTECLKASCDAKTGACSLQPDNIGGPCDDTKPCTVATTCDKSGVCAGGKANPCDDGDACTVDSCTPGKGGGCVHKLKLCADGNACTLDGCDAKTGKCKVGNKPDGTVCNGDNNGCTVNDACKSGVCTTGSKPSCAAKVGVCQARICQSTGHFSFGCVTVSKPDGVPCPDTATSCHVGATCKAGSCAAGVTPRLWHNKPSGKGDAWLEDVVTRPNDTVVAVGGQTLSGTGQGAKRGWLMLAINGVGKTLWTRAYAADTTDASHYAGAALAKSDGTVWVAGLEPLDGSHGLRMLRMSTTGSVIGSKATAVKKGTTLTRVADMAALPGGRIAVLVDRLNGTTPFSNVWFMEASGAYKLHQWWPGSSRRIAVMGDRLINAYWRIEGSKQGWGYGVMSATTGQSLVSLAYGFNASWTHAAVEPTKRGWFLSILTPPAGKAGMRTQIVTKGGTLLRQHTTAFDSGIALGSVSTGTGVYVVGRTEGAAHVGFTGRLDALGNMRWQRVFDPGARTQLSAVTALGADGVAAGWTGQAGKRQPLVVRFNDLGFSGCDVLGKCAGRTLGSCDDGKDCTTDGCDANAGCQHTAHLEQVCDPKDGCSILGDCTLGACKSGTDGLLHNTINTWQQVANRRQDAVVESTDGRVRSYVVASDNVYTMLHDKYGRAGAPSAMGLCKQISTAIDAKPLANGGLLVSGYSGPKGKDLAARAVTCRIDPDGSIAWHYAYNVPCSPCGHKFRRAAEYTDGSLFIVGSRLKGQYGALVVKLSGAGKPAWSYAYAKSNAQIGGHGVVATTDGGAVATGRHRATGSYYKGALVGVAHNGKPRFEQLIATGVSAELNHVARIGKGDVLAVGRARPNASVWGLLMVRVNAKTGKLVWTRQADTPDLAWGLGIATEPTGGAVVAGDITEGGRKKVFLDRIDDNGDRVWRRTYLARRTFDARIGLRGVTRWKGGYVIGMGVVNGSAGIIKTDHGGNDGCKASGVCIGKQPVDCDDKDACTVDYCDAKLGCRHSKTKGCP